MDIVIRGGIQDRKQIEKEKVIYFGPDKPFFKDFDPRALRVGLNKDRVRDYNYLIRITEEGFDYGVAKVIEGPRAPSIAVFIRVGWLIPNKGGCLMAVLEEMAKKTERAIETYVASCKAEISSGQFQNPLEGTDFDQIKRKCDFREIEKLNVKDQLLTERIVLTGEVAIDSFFENPYQIGQISSKGVVVSAWNDITQSTFPNDIVKPANISQNYLYKSLHSNLWSLQLSGNVNVKYYDPIKNEPREYKDAITGRDSRYLECICGRLIRQKTAEEADINFKYKLKIDCEVVGKHHRMRVNPHQTDKGIIVVSYKDIPQKMLLTYAGAQSVEFEITKDDIIRGTKYVSMSANVEELTIYISGNGVDKTPITVKVDTVSPAYYKLKELSSNHRSMKLPRPRQEVEKIKKRLSVLLWILVFLAFGAVIYFGYQYVFVDETINQEQFAPPTPKIEEKQSSSAEDIKEDKKYFKGNNAWNISSLKSEEAKAFFGNVRNWEIEKIKNDKSFGNCAENKALNDAITAGDDPTLKERISEKLNENSNYIDLKDLNDFIKTLNDECNGN